MNTKEFYDEIRITLFNRSISANQFEGIEAIINEYNNRCLNDLRKLAYILATAYHETAKTMQPIKEYGQGKAYKYGRKIKQSGVAYISPNQIYYGRGFVQLTWYENYEAMGKALKIDLLNNPDLALDMSHSIEIMFEGMIKGMFTGRKLSNYFTEDVTDYVNARRIINGTDKAEHIASIAKLFYAALT